MPRVQRHFPRLTNRALFSPERLLTPPPSTLRSTFIHYDKAILSDSDNETIIKKPIGELGKEYKLKSALCIVSDNEYNDIQAYINVLTNEHLKTDVTYIKQSSDDIDFVCKKASDKYPILRRFQRNWAAIDFVKLELRRTVLQAKKNKKNDTVSAPTRMTRNCTDK